MRSPSGGDPEKHRPLERRAALRTAVVWDAVQQVLGAPGGRIVDIGGGTGGFAVRPEGSRGVLDEIVAGRAESAGGGGPEAAGGHDPEAAGRELARRMKLARADDILREAEAMAA